jgi:cobalt-zinc-cadmium efflux system membrane fusion protein
MTKTLELRAAALLASLLTAALAGCGDSTPADAAQPAPALVHDQGRLTVPPASPLRKTLQVAAAAEQTVERPLLVPGVVEADPARLVKVVPPVSGRIVELRKGLGDAVKAGEALFVLDSADLAQAGSDATKAHAALALAQHNLQRQTELAQAEIGARKDLEQAESDFAQARSEAQRTQGRLAQLGTSLGGNSRQYTLRSPLTGRVIDLTGARGGFWNDTNAPVMTVADLSRVWVAASVREKDLATVFVGQAAGITFDAYEGQPVTGKVAYIGEVLDPDTRTIKVRIALDNATGRYRPGMFAKVSFNGPAHAAVVVPAAAVVQNSFNARVFVETAPWAFQPRIVKVGAQLGDRIEIADGLKAGERVVVKDGVLLND